MGSVRRNVRACRKLCDGDWRGAGMTMCQADRRAFCWRRDNHNELYVQRVRCGWATRRDSCSSHVGRCNCENPPCTMYTSKTTGVGPSTLLVLEGAITLNMHS